MDTNCQWTSKRPEGPGYYWYKPEFGSAPEIVQVWPTTERGLVMKGIDYSYAWSVGNVTGWWASVPPPPPPFGARSG